MAAALCGALALVGVLYEHPLVLAAALAAVVGGRPRPPGWASELRARARLALPLALLVTLVNPLVYQRATRC